MVRKPCPLDRIEKITRLKKRSISTSPEANVALSPKKNRSDLNDKILDLYKKDMKKKGTEEIASSKTFFEEEEILDEGTPARRKSQQVLDEVPKKHKKKLSVWSVKQSTITFEDVCGLEKIFKKISKLLLPLKDPEMFEKLGVKPIRGFLLHGPPGCGKTHLARAIAGQFKLPYIEVAATELVCGVSGESESKIRDMFEEAVRNAPCILFIDEIDAVCPKREASDKSMERRMVAQLLKCLDELNEKDMSTQVMVIGATNRPDSLDPALRRGGRFDKELAIGMPDENVRLRILERMCKELQLDPNFDMQRLAHHTPGYVGGDLKSLVTEAVAVGVWRIISKFIKSSCESNGDGFEDAPPKLKMDYENDVEISLESILFWLKSSNKVPEEELENVYFQQSDFEIALQNCIPYSKREGFATVPNVTWSDVGALDDIKEQLQETIVWPVKYRKLYEKSYMPDNIKGILLHGPKGCGKTLLAKAIANECSINFLSVKGPELLSMYFGESERAVRQCFQRARNSAPCVIFFDELDALCSTRTGTNMNTAAERVVNQLLIEMDGIEERKQVFVIGATNLLEKIDYAMLRPGRLEKIIYVDIPSPSGRVEILNSITVNKTRPKISEHVSLEEVAYDSRCENFSGADLAYLVRESSCKAMKERINSGSLSEEPIQIEMRHFELAFSVVKPSISKRVCSPLDVSSDAAGNAPRGQNKRKRSKERIPWSKRRNQMADAISRYLQDDAEQENRSSVFGKSVGMELELVENSEQRDIAKKLISDVIFMAKRGKLTSDSRIQVDVIPSLNLPQFPLPTFHPTASTSYLASNQVQPHYHANNSNF